LTVRRIAAASSTEYAKGGIPRYWVVERDNGTTVHRYVFDRDTGSELRTVSLSPSAWLLTITPDIS
jgi:hypothetical protein